MDHRKDGRERTYEEMGNQRKSSGNLQFQRDE
jgi:hypothetical protein